MLPLCCHRTAAAACDMCGLACARFSHLQASTSQRHEEAVNSVPPEDGVERVAQPQAEPGLAPHLLTVLKSSAGCACLAVPCWCPPVPCSVVVFYVEWCFAVPAKRCLGAWMSLHVCTNTGRHFDNRWASCNTTTTCAHLGVCVRPQDGTLPQQWKQHFWLENYVISNAGGVIAWR